jgi:DNA gyrase subunit A
MPVVETIPLHETTRERYLNYALSVITSRALPDIRDGLKPVQRRILYAMYTNLRLYPDGRFRKSATVVGEVMGKYHPHGDSAIYEAMVRMAQAFSLRAPLVDGHGNFGSIDGDSPAAMRYTEARLQPLAMEMLQEIRKQTVDFRPNFDGTLFEPIVLPARVPNLLVNGASGIAVGMATNIPPHNLGEVVDALIYLIDHRPDDAVTADESPSDDLATIVDRFIGGPDFPTGGRILNSSEELLAIYRNGEGAVDLRGEYEVEGKSRVIITSIPYGHTKADIVEKIAEHIIAERVPQLTDIRDESTDDVRVVLEVKRGADPEAALAYLFKHTPLQTRFHVNLTCLVPTENPEIAAPAKVDLLTVLRHFLTFRMEVVVRRLQFELEQLEKRIHILRGFAKIFDALDEAIRIIRSSEDKKDAAQRLIHRFQIDEEQADAILETKLYRLAKMEIDSILRELAEKELLAQEIRELLEDEEARWQVVRSELAEVREAYADERRSTISGPDAVLSYSAEDYIISEDVFVIVTRDGWVKRQRSYSDVQSIRARDGDEVGWVLAGSTRATIGFFTNFGRAYTVRIAELPSTTGYGDPIQKLFDFSDREKVVGVISFDSRVLPEPAPLPDASPSLFGKEEVEAPADDADVEGPYLVSVSKHGQIVRVLASAFADASTRSGRLYMRLGKNDEALKVEAAAGNENVCIASRESYVLIFPLYQVSLFKGVAKGVRAIRLGSGDVVLGFTLSGSARDGLEVETSRGRKEIVRTTKFEVSNRGNRGRQIIRRGTLKRVIEDPVELRLNGRSD